MDTWWPSQLYDSEDIRYDIEGNDETAVFVVSSDTRVINYVMECRIVQGWRYQPITPVPGPRTPTVTPVPRATIAPSGDFARVWGLLSQQHGYTPVKQVLGFATGPEKVVWMSKIEGGDPRSILWGGRVFRRSDNNQTFIARILPGGRMLWEARTDISGPFTEKDFLGTIQHFRVAQPCRDRNNRVIQCFQDGLMLWTYDGQDRSVEVLYGDGHWDTFDSSEGWIAYSCTGSGGAQVICAVKSDGSVRTKLTDDPKGDSYARWSPDGSQLVFVSGRDVPVPHIGEIYLLTANRVQRLTISPDIDTAPAWSPDGTQIAFASRRDGNFEIYVLDIRNIKNIDPFGAGLRNLTSHPATDTQPAWSPDGRRIAFVSTRDGSNKIYLMNANGTGVTSISDGRYDSEPAWSPDGERIAFTSSRDGNYGVFVMNANGSNLKRLTPNTIDARSPVWSPDGERLAYCYNAQGGFRLATMSADGSSGMTFAGIVGCPSSWR